MIHRRLLLTLALISAAIVGLVAAVTDPSAAAKPPVYTGLVKGVAVGGYDAVAFLTEGKAVKGDTAITLSHEGATWRFASAANRDAFLADPAKYAPKYGGYCAYAVSMGYTAKGDPEAWSVVDGRLYLNYDKSVRATWLKDTAGHIKSGDLNWPDVLGR